MGVPVLRSSPVEVLDMTHRRFEIAAGLLSALLLAPAATPVPAQAAAALREPEAASGPYARIAFLRARDGNTVDFEAGYARHLDWHRRAGDAWTWYGWTISHGDRQRSLVYATFGHAAADFDAAVSPAEDERDTSINVLAHSEFTGSGLYEFLPGLSRGSGVPTPAARVEMLTVDLPPGTGGAFEAALARGGPPREETLWFRMAAGGAAPRYVRLRPAASLAAVLAHSGEPPLPDPTARLAARTTVEILTLRPTLSIGLPAAP
jgi:hypothetical protein